MNSHPSNRKPVKTVCFLVRKMDQGGAQRQLVELLKGIDRTRMEISVLSFYPGGLFSGELEAMEGVKLISLDKKGRWDVAGFLVRLATVLRRINPDVLHAYQGLPNSLSVMMKPFLPRTKVVWGVRNARRDGKARDWLFDIEFSLQKFLSRYADIIITNSRAGLRFYSQCGFPEDRMKVVPNGIDTRRFRPDPESGARIRAELGLEGRPVIGVVGRLDPIKGHGTFLEAAAMFAEKRERARYLVVGDGPGRYPVELRHAATRLGLEGKIVWAGERADMPGIYNAMDLLTSSSVSEGFPNAICEAMACGRPCVVTDVGDSAFIVDKLGKIVPPGDPAAMAAAWEECLDGNPESRIAEIRGRIVGEFSLESLAAKTLELL